MKRIITFQSILGVAGVTIFIVSHIVAVAGLFLWITIGYFRLGPAASVAVSAIAAIPVLLVSAKVALLAYEAETDPENNGYRPPERPDVNR
ncbi:hypothetical protein [Oricola thermophila]|uniref:Uncharacterized protein n=1 Tax=Oricola thermophila TaxID=2742145 RepID=A0A6N1VHT5_9HYPH|nr:hypothetical protein [Oricola thermophila]QKV19265.1 hypothetical protein HTY61_12760 [Oricola thermophila]